MNPLMAADAPRLLNATSDKVGFSSHARLEMLVFKLLRKATAATSAWRITSLL
jgi:hypothetical protein